jgi:hypothetical protein
MHKFQFPASGPWEPVAHGFFKSYEIFPHHRMAKVSDALISPRGLPVEAVAFEHEAATTSPGWPNK